MQPQRRLPVFYITLYIFLKGINDYIGRNHLSIIEYKLYFITLILFIINFLVTFSSWFPWKSSLFIQAATRPPLHHHGYDKLLHRVEILKNYNKVETFSILGTNSILNESMIWTIPGKEYKNLLYIFDIYNRYISLIQSM